MTRKGDEYANYVEHPRYGRRPYLTGLNPVTVIGDDTHLHWHAKPEVRVPNTAIEADLSRQSPATIAVTHYYDEKRQCRDCRRMFLFFAAEQKYWHEDLGFGPDSDCVRCFPCRQQPRGLARKRERYEALFHLSEPTAEQNLELAECSLALVEAGEFHPRQIERVRMYLNRVRKSSGGSALEACEELLARVAAFENRAESPRVE
jgi:hypothetical protein